MQSFIRDSNSLKVTVDEQGKVWHVVGIKRPINSGKSIGDFMDLAIVSQATCVRAAGLTANTDLLIQLYARKLRGELTSLQVCTPLCCPTSLDRKDPELVLYQMRNLELAASLGGWHEFDCRDYPAYAIASQLRRRVDNSVDVISQKMLNWFPGWPALSFVAGLNIDKCAELIGLILDPRWYVDVIGDPNQGEKLEQFLGLTSRIQGGVSEKSDWRHARCQLVLQCWKTEPPSESVMKLPQNFLWRTWYKRKGDKADLATSRLFVNFLRLTWLAAVSNTHSRRLFVPKYFFAVAADAKAFSEHMCQKT